MDEDDLVEMNLGRQPAAIVKRVRVFLTQTQNGSIELHVERGLVRKCSFHDHVHYRKRVAKPREPV